MVQRSIDWYHFWPLLNLAGQSLLTSYQTTVQKHSIVTGTYRTVRYRTEQASVNTKKAKTRIKIKNWLLRTLAWRQVIADPQQASFPLLRRSTPRRWGGSSRCSLEQNPQHLRRTKAGPPDDPSAAAANYHRRRWRFVAQRAVGSREARAGGAGR
jgi:hypothetical protein